MKTDTQSSCNNDGEKSRQSLSRRGFLLGAGATAAGAALAGLKSTASHACEDELHAGAHQMSVVGECESGTLDPESYLRAFDGGKVTPLGNGKVLREYVITAYDKEIDPHSRRSRSTSATPPSPVSS